MAEDPVVIPVSLEPDLASTQKAGEELGKKLSKTLEQSTRLDLSDAVKKDMITAKNLATHYAELSEKIAGLQGTSKPIAEQAKAFDIATKNVTKYSALLEKLKREEAEADEASKRLNKSILAKAAERRDTEDKNLAEALKRAEAERDKYEKAIAAQELKYMRSNGTDKDTAKRVLSEENTAYINRLALLKKYEDAVDAIHAKQEQFNAKKTGDFITEAEMSRAVKANDIYTQFADKIQEVTDKLEANKAVLADTTFVKYEDTDQYIKDVQQLEDIVNKLAMSMSKIKLPEDNGLSRLREIVGDVGQRISGLISKIASLAKTSIAKGIKRLGKSFKSLGRETDKSNISLDKAVKTFIKYGLGARSFFYLFRRIRSAIVAVFKELGKENFGEIGASINALTDSLNYLKNGFVSAFAPIINFVTPALTALMDTLSGLMNTIGAFFAMLTGKSVYTKAIKQTGTLAKETKAGADAQKEWKNELYSFDELNKATKNDDSGSGSGAATGFEEVPIGADLSDRVKEWIERLKEAWESANFAGVGLLIAESLNEMLYVATDWIDNTFRPWAVKWSANIANILNGIVAGLDWEALGNLIAQGINTVFDIANTFLTTFDFDLLGRRVGDGIKSIFDNVEWDLLGQTFANKWNALIDFIYSFVTTPGLWQSIGEALSTWINNAVDNIDWEKVGNLIAEAIIGFGEFIVTAVKNIDWKKVWDALRSFLKGIVDKVKEFFGIKSPSTVFAEIGRNLIDGLLQGIRDRWRDIVSFFSDGLSNLLNSFRTSWTTLTQNTSTSWNNIRNNVTTAFSNIRSNVTSNANTIRENITTTWNNLKSNTASSWSSIKTSITSLWSRLKSDLKSISFYDVGSNLVNGIKEGISGAWSSVKNTLSRLCNDLISTAKRAFNEHSPSKVFATIGENVSLGLAQGITDGSDNAVHATEEMADSVSDVDFALQNLPNSLDAVLARLTRLADRFTSINDAMLNMAKIPVPAVAMGRVVPAYATSNASIESNTSLANSIAEAITNAFDARSTKDPATGVVKIYINGKEVFDAVVDENNSAIMRTGESPLW